MTAPIAPEKSYRVAGGDLSFYAPPSEACGGTMRFALFTPPGDPPAGGFPLLYWLSGLTCTADNFAQKAGAFGEAARLGLAIVMPDTSPRGAGIPGEDESWDFGTGAGFYLDATEAPWRARYRMETYVTGELPGLLADLAPLDPGRVGISGHSMGGHGALTLALRHPGRYRSVSAFAPICAPMTCPWGEKAFTGYLGDDRDAWAAHDASRLVATRQLDLEILIDQGTADEFLAEQLNPAAFQEACAAAGQDLRLRLQEGYDHSYYFVATFIGEHLRHHAAALAA